MELMEASQLVLVCAAVIIDRAGKVLLTKRPGSTHLGGMWEFPGGKLEQGELPKACVKRECMEECAIEVDVHEIFEVVFHRYPQKNVLLLFYRCSLVSGQVKHVGVDAHAWCKASELSTYCMPPADLPVVTRLMKVYDAMV